MPRRVQDIVPADRRSMRDISTPETKPQRPPAVEKERHIPLHRISSLTPPESKPPAPRPRRSRKGLWVFLLVIVIVAVVAVAGFFASTYFSRATFIIVPKSFSVAVNGVYSAQFSSATSSLTYDLLPMQGKETATVPASNGSPISTKAQGSVTFYNSSGNQSQKLVAGTRLSDTNGRIYRLTSSIVIPGSTSSGGSTIPGNTTAMIIADQAGEAYNVSSSGTVSDFKIVNFKDTSKYDTIYARLSKDLTGGFIGTKKVVAPAVLASTTATLESRLTATLLAQAKAAVPEGDIMYDSGYVTVFSAPSVSGNDATTATVTVQGTLYGILFHKDAFVSRLAGATTTAAFSRFSYDTVGLDSLALTIANAKDFSPIKRSALVVRIKGTMKLSGKVPVEEIKRKLAGTSLSDIKEVLKAYDPVIATVSGELMPPWSSIPSDSARISVVVRGR